MNPGARIGDLAVAFQTHPALSGTLLAAARGQG